MEGGGWERGRGGEECGRGGRVGEKEGGDTVKTQQFFKKLLSNLFKVLNKIARFTG